MHHFSIFITLLLLFRLHTFTVAAVSSNDPVTTTSQLSINCGSVSTPAALNGRGWIGDIQPKGSSLLQIRGSSTDSTVEHSSVAAHQVPHKTARISTSQFSYAFRVSPGEKIICLHFNPAPYKGFGRLNDLFNVEAGPFTLLTNFSASLTAAAHGVNTISKEFCISLGENQTFTLTFSTVTSELRDTAYAFINGIEIIPVPLRRSYLKGGDLRAQVVGQALVSINNTTALELTHRYLVSFSDDKAKENEINGLTWKTPVDVGYRYLVRIHFCDLRLHGEGLKVLIDEVIVDANITVQWDDEYGIIDYRDYVMAVKGRKEEGKRDLLISLQSNDEFVDVQQLIKGFEIFKLSNPDNSLSSPNVFPSKSDSPPWTISNILPILSQGKATATLAIAILSLMNITVYKLREIYEARSVVKEENIPSAKAERHCRRFSLAEIQSATKNFSERLLIGRGGFGKVYIGFVDNGRETVAIKRLKSDSRQGKHEFLTEIETLCELRHINLVSLIGFCSDHLEMILVYEYMPSGTLADHLHEYAREGKDSCSLTWKQRLDICIGTARGLDYLHTGNGVIHRDVKASNILLDENFIAKVSDFGLAKHEDRIKLQSHVSTRVKGTHGYMDPYYQNTGKLTRKSDVYAFGVVLLEVLCERKALGPRFGEEYFYLTVWAQNKIKEGEVDKIVASTLLEEILPDSLKAFVEVAERCLHKEPKQRPTMAQIVVQLESALEHQESGKSAGSNHVVLVANDVCPKNEHMTSSSNAALSAEAFSDVYAKTSPPMEKTNLDYFPDGEEDLREPKSYKARFWALDALWNRLKPSKRKEIRLVSELCEADIRVPKYEFSKLAAATNFFSNSNRIGQGRFAQFYKAVLPTGRTVAVKRYSSQAPVDWFRNEILSVSGLHHRNIIKLLGYCIHEKTRMLLYEFMQNGSLDRYIENGHWHINEERCRFQWSRRFNVIIGIAKGVIYLHQESSPTMIHGNLNPANILLDNEMNPKISGFVFARNTEDVQSQEFSCIAGTTPYSISTDVYAILRRDSEKSDVYSFGVLVMEILSGKRNNRDMGNPIGNVWALWRENWNLLTIIDTYLGGEFSGEEALRCIQVCLLCTQDEPQERPTMDSALRMLLGEDLSLQEKMKRARCPARFAADISNSDSFNPRNWSE